MATDLKGFTVAAQGLSRSPLGIIALFIVLIYGFAALVVGLGGQHLGPQEQAHLVWFLALFPVVVLGVFAWLVARHHMKLYGPADMGSAEGFLKLQEVITRMRREIAILSEVSPVAINLDPGDREHPPAARRRMAAVVTDDPQKGQWGGKRRSGAYEVSAGAIRPLHSDPDNFRIPLEVRSTDPAAHPLLGMVKFHIHDTFRPDMEEIAASGGVARLELVAYGAFTVGVQLEDGTTLEIDLADEDIDAPKQFKDN